jgi:MFS family permease
MKKNSHSARVALSLLQRLAHRNEPLAGDLLEEFQSRRSSAWLWAQLLLAIALGSFREPRVPVALNLTPIDPIVAEWLIERKLGARKPVNLTGTPIEGVGGLSAVILGFLLSTVVPEVWWFVVGGIVCGAALGTTLVYARRKRPMEADGQIHNGQLKDLFIA